MYSLNIKDRILYEDKDILVCHKPAGLAVQNARIGAMDLESMLKNYISTKNPGKMPYLAVVHRLDQPVEGILVFALNQKAAASLSSQMAGKDASKKYLAVTDRIPENTEGILEDYLKKEPKGNVSSVVSKGTKGAKKARLAYKVLETEFLWKFIWKPEGIIRSEYRCPTQACHFLETVNIIRKTIQSSLSGCVR